MAAALFVGEVGQAQAQTSTWTATGAGSWSTGANWSGSSVPTSGESLAFGSGGTSPVLTDDLMTPSTYTVAGITFNSGASAFTINPATSGTNGFTLTTGIANNSTSLETINDLVALSGADTFTMNSGGITLGGAVSGSGSITTAGTGTLILSSASNTFSGGATVNSGTLAGDSFGSGAINLGNASSSTSNATLQLGTSSVDTIANAINVQSGSTGTLTISSANYAETSSGAISLNNNLNVLNNTTGGGSSLTLSGGVSGTGNLTILANAASGGTINFTTNPLNFSGTITNSGTGSGSVNISSLIGLGVQGVTQNSATSTLILSNANSNSYGNGNTGVALEIDAGTLQAESFGNSGDTINLGASSGSANATFQIGVVNSDSVANQINVDAGSTGTLTITASTAHTQTVTGGIVLSNNLTLLNSGTSTSFDGLQIEGGITGTGNLITKAASNGVINISSGALDFTGTITNSGAGAAITTISSNIGSLVTGVTQNSATSELLLTGANTYGGATVTAGTLALAAPSGNTFSGNISVATGGTVALINGVTNTLSGAITGGGAVTQSGAGETYLTNASNTYSGATTINAGTLAVQSLGTGAIYLGASSGSANATFQIGAISASSASITNTLYVDSGSTGVLTITDDYFTGHTQTLAGGIVLSNNVTLYNSGSTNLSISGGITGTGNVITDAVSTGAINISGGALNFTGTITNSGSNSGATNISSNIGSNVQGVTQHSATSVLTLSGTNTYSGNTSVSAGTLSLTGSLTGSNVATSGTGIISETSAGAIGGTGTTFTQGSSGASLLSGTNTYTGGTSINAGSLEFSTTSSMPATGTVSVANGATLVVATGGSGWTTGTSGAGTIGGLFSGVGGQTGSTVTLNSGSAVGIDTTSGNQTYAGAITNTGVGLTKLGANTLILSGTGNTYTGATTIDDGALEVQSSGTGAIYLGASSGTNGATLVLGDANGYTVSGTLYVNAGTTGTLEVSTGSSGHSSGLAAIVLNNNLELYIDTGSGVGGFGATGGITGTGNLTIDVTNASTNITPSISSGAVNFNGMITNNGNGSSTFTISSAIGSLLTGITENSTTSALDLTGANGYNGATTITAGTLEVGGAGVLGNGSYTGAISDAGTFLYASSANDALSGVISGAGVVTKNTSTTSTLVLSGANTYTGATTISTGTVMAENASALGANQTTDNVTVALGAGLDYAAKANSPLVIGGTLGVTGGSGSTIGGSIGSTTTGAEINVTGAATFSNAALKVNIYGISGVTPVAGTNTYTLVAGGSGSSLNPATAATLGTVYNNSNFTVGALSQTATALNVSITSQTALTSAYWQGGLTGNTAVWAASNGSTTSNWVTSVGGSSQALVPGSGTTVTFSDTGHITTAPIATTLGANMSIAGLVIQDTVNGLTLNNDANSDTLTIGSGGITMNASVPVSTIAAPVALGTSQTWTNNSANALTVSGLVSDGGSGYGLTKAGSSIVNLSNTANTFGGAVAVNSGSVEFASGASSATAAQSLGENASLTLGVVNASSGVLDYNGTGATTLAKAISALGNGSDTIENTGTGLLTLSGGLAKNGTKLTLNGGANGINVTTNGITGSNAGSDLLVTGGLTEISVASSYNGPTTVYGGGTLENGVANALPTGTTVNMGSATLESASNVNNYNLNGNNQTVAGITSTNGSAGTDTNTIGSTTAATLTVAPSGSDTYSGVLGGSGQTSLALTMGGTGTLTLGGTNTYTGATTVSAGTLALSSGGSLAGTAVSVGGTGTLQINGNRSIGTSGVASVSVNSGGTLSLVDGTINTLTLNTTSGSSLVMGGGGTLAFDLGATSDQILLSSGTASVTGNTTVTITSLGGLTGSTQTLISAPGGGLGTTGFTLGAITGSTGSYTLSLNETNNDLFLNENVTAVAAAFWSGANGSAWNTTSPTANFNTTLSGGTPIGALPTSVTNVTFTATGASNASATTLGQDFTINSLTFNTAGVGIGGSNTLTILAGTANGHTMGDGITSSGSGTNTISSAVALGSSQTWTVNTSNTLAVSGLVSDGGSAYSLTTAGAGKLSLTNSTGNTYTGGTTVGGTTTLLIGNTSGSATGSGALAVLKGAALAGTGTSSGSSFAIGATGSGTAHIYVGQSGATGDTNVTSNLTLTGGSGLNNSTIANANLTFNLNTNSAPSLPGQGNELLVGNTGIAFGSAVTLTLNLQGSGTAANVPYFVLIAGTAGTSGPGQDGSQYTGLSLGTSFAQDGGTLTPILNSSVGGSGNLVLALDTTNYTGSGFYAGQSGLFLFQTAGGIDDIVVIPEPSTWEMFALGLGLLAFILRKRKNIQSV